MECIFFHKNGHLAVVCQSKKRQQHRSKSAFEGNNQEKQKETEFQDYNLFDFPDGTHLSGFSCH